MRADRVAIVGTVALVVGLSLATGPAVGILSIPEGGVGDGDSLGQGSADVAVVSTPETAQLVAGDYGDVHYLSVPESTLAVSNVTGSPVLTLSIDVDDLGYSRSTIFFLGESNEARQSLTIDRSALNSSQLDQDSYEGQYRIVQRDSNGSTTLHDGSIRIEVAE